MKVHKFKLTAAKGFFILNGDLWSGITLLIRKRIYSKAVKPKTYRAVAMFICNERGKYKEDNVTVYKTRRGYVASFYKGKCFYPYYAACILNEYKK